ncbi:hypothetical protein N7450_011690 [Penicillium hetheringtonii]|uniref:Uncharacterized protein n=1 Tax=Penicillium hetheringtonii TaxID=911720 RepID=A0AAD6DCK0_9EURO|nr:hypothetical protein N7450_011690 [Penicillium hetheringtonii]
MILNKKLENTLAFNVFLEIACSHGIVKKAWLEKKDDDLKWRGCRATSGRTKYNTCVAYMRQQQTRETAGIPKRRQRWSKY